MIHQNLRRERQRRGVSQLKLAETVGVYQSMISAVENGKRRPSLTLAIAIAQALGTTVDALAKSEPNQQ